MFIQLVLILGIVNAELLYVQVLFRHGHRNPLHNVLDLEIDNSQLKQISPLGIQQMQLLGEYLREQYGRFIDYEMDTIYVRSSPSNRTVISAQTVVDTLFRKKQFPQTNKNISPNYDQGTIKLGVYQPVPIHVSEEFDKIFKTYHQNVCPIVYNLKRENVESKEYINYGRDFKNLTFWLKNITKDNPNSHRIKQDTIELFVDNIVHDPILFNITDEEVQRLNDYKFLLRSLRLFQTREQIDLFGSPYGIDLLKRMQNRLSGSRLKMVIDSVHESTMIMVLNYFNMSSSNCVMNWLYKMKPYCIYQNPGFGSNLIFELHRDIKDDGETHLYVLVKYNGEKRLVCSSIEKCDFDLFKARIDDSTVTDFDYRCQIRKIPWDEIIKYSSYLAILLFVYLKYWKLTKSKTD